MKNRVLICLAVASVCLALCGCRAQKPKTVGFLSDYSKLSAMSDVSFKYFPPGNPRARYSKFIIDPVEIRFYDESKGAKMKEKDLDVLTTYMRDALVTAFGDEYEVVYAPGPGVGQIRMALTNLKKSKIPLNIMPIGKILGSGLGGTTLEAEMVDSQTGEQIGAIVESQLGNRLSLAGYTTWGDAKAVMNQWAKRFRQRLDGAH